MIRYWWHWTLILSLTMSDITPPSLASSPSKQINPKSELPTQNILYKPIPLPIGVEVKDTLSDRDIPNGDGGFARDYLVKYNAGDQIAIDLISDVFDTVLIFLSADGKTIGKNDDSPDGSSNSLLFVRIKDTGTYIIRVQGFGETSGGNFTLKVSKLKPIS
jgi:hypothetical protein